MSFNVCTNRYASWHLNQTSGTNAPDNSVNNRNGTLVNTPTWVAGKLHNCLNFVSASSQYVDCGAIASWEYNQSFSIELWFKTTSTGTTGLVSKYDSVLAKGYFVYLNTGLLAIYMLSGASNYIKVHVAITVNDGVWHHAVVTYSGTGTATGVKFYVDGNLQTNVVDGNNLSGTIINTTNLKLGVVATAYYDGQIDETVLYDRVITQTEVTGRWNSGIGTEACCMPSQNALMGHDF